MKNKLSPLRRELIDILEHEDINAPMKQRLIQVIMRCDHEYEVCHLLLGALVSNIKLTDSLMGKKIHDELNRVSPRSILIEEE